MALLSLDFVAVRNEGDSITVRKRHFTHLIAVSEKTSSILKGKH